MSLDVLANSVENMRARTEIRRRNLDFVTPWFARILHKMRVTDGVSVGDFRKSWDVLRTIQFLEQHVSKTTPVLDVGAYASELLCSLHKLGFSDLTGIDLNPNLTSMPYREKVKYVIGDFTDTGFPDGTFGAITAISVIEHGFCGPKLFREAARLLRKGGYLVGSTDYWPRKIHTQDITPFALDWTIFSREEVAKLIREARVHGLVPVGKLNFEASEAVVRWSRRNYTFAWFAFQKAEVHVAPVHE